VLFAKDLILACGLQLCQSIHKMQKQTLGFLISSSKSSSNKKKKNFSKLLQKEERTY
jgi:hypothetical protein